MAAYAKILEKASPLVTRDTPINAMKYPLIMLHLEAVLYSNLINENSDAVHTKCLLGPHLAGGPQIPHHPALDLRKAFDSENHSILLSKT